MSLEIVGYVCVYCEKSYKASVCPECNEYDGMIPITKSILAMFDDPELLGECDTCEQSYDVSSRDGRCGDCGDCSRCCQH